MSPELQQRLILLAKAVALLGLLILGFLWIVWYFSSDPAPQAATQSNHIATNEPAPVASPVVASAPPTPQPETVAPTPEAAPPLPEPQTTTASDRDPGDEFYRMGLYPQALKYWSAQADKGDAKAAYRVGVEYMEGKEGVTPKDYAAALKYLGIAAEKGDARAQFDLGTLYEYGHGVEKSPEKAAEWYRKAAERGHPQAQWTLATKLETGEGVLKDHIAALTWYYIAADNGFRAAPVAAPGTAPGDAPYAYEVLAAQLTRDQAQEARMQANDFTPLTN
jgi:TPR repeat protein